MPISGSFNRLFHQKNNYNCHMLLMKYDMQNVKNQMCEKVHVIKYIWKQHFRIWYFKYGMWNVKHQKFHLKKKKTLSNLFHWYFNTILTVRHHSNNTDSLIFHQTFTPFPLNFPTMYYIFVTFSPLFQHSLLTFTFTPPFATYIYEAFHKPIHWIQLVNKNINYRNLHQLFYMFSKKLWQ